MSKPKATRFVRVRLDFSIALLEESDSFAAVIGPKDPHRMMMALCATLSGHPNVKGIAPGMVTGLGMDNRPRDAKGRLVK